MSARIVTVSRQVGTSGEEVAFHVAERLKFRVIDYQVIQEAARDAGVSPETVSEAEHTPSLMTRILEALARNPSMPMAAWADPLPLTTTPLFTSEDYRGFIEDVIRDLGARGNSVIVGHAAQVILKNRPDALRVFVTGSPKYRVQRVMQGMAVDEKTAARTIEKTDAERVEFFNRVYETAWLSPASYDLCVNTDLLSPEKAAEIIVHAASLK